MPYIRGMETIMHEGLELQLCAPIDKGYGLIPNLIGLQISGQAVDGSGLVSIHSNISTQIAEDAPALGEYAKAIFARKTAAMPQSLPAPWLLSAEGTNWLLEKDENGHYKHLNF